MQIEVTDSFEYYKILVDKNQGLLRLDKFIISKYANVSRNRVQAAIDCGFVVVNKKLSKPSYQVKPFDEIIIKLPVNHISSDLLPEEMDLDIVYEDDYLLVLNKPAGLVVHPGYNNWQGTLVNGLLFYFNNLPNKDKQINRPGLVHRIDKDTSGLLVIAKDEVSMTYLAKQFYDHSVERNYIALVWGDLIQESGTIIKNLIKLQANRKVIVTTDICDQGKKAITHYEVIKRYKIFTLIKCRLETGRTHQIRVHLSSIGHPLFGDCLYGGNKLVSCSQQPKYKQFIDNCLKIMNYQALHANTLGFIHPILHKKIFVESEIPKNFKLLLNKIENYVETYNIA